MGGNHQQFDPNPIQREKEFCILPPPLGHPTFPPASCLFTPKLPKNNKHCTFTATGFIVSFFFLLFFLASQLRLHPTRCPLRTTKNPSSTPFWWSARSPYTKSLLVPPAAATSVENGYSPTRSGPVDLGSCPAIPGARYDSRIRTPVSYSLLVLLILVRERTPWSLLSTLLGTLC